MRREPAGERRLTRTPAMLPDREPPGASHWCETVGSRVYAPKGKCPHDCTDTELHAER